MRNTEENEMKNIMITISLGLTLILWSISTAQATPPKVVTDTLNSMEEDQLVDVEVATPERSEPELTPQKVRCTVSDLRRMKDTHKSLLDIAHECGLSMAQVKMINKERHKKINELRGSGNHGVLEPKER